MKRETSYKTMVVYVIRISFFCFYFMMAYYLVFHQVHTQGGVQGFESDTLEHVEFLKQYFAGERFIPHPLWHTGSKAIAIICGLDIETATIVFTSATILFWVGLVYRLSMHALKQTVVREAWLKEVMILSLVSVITVIGPMYIPQFQSLIYLGQGSPNIWHSVTLWTVKPLALIAIVSSIKFLQSSEIKWSIVAAIFALASVVAKPSFILIFMPALFVLILIRRRTKKNFLFFSLLAVAVSSILIYQYLHTFGHGSRIVVDFLGVWSSKSPNVAISLLLALAFPALFLLLYQKTIDNDYVLLAWMQMLVGIFLYALFAEKGHKYLHGNFGWSYMLGLSFVYLFSILEFVKGFRFMVVWKRVVLSGLLLLQTAIGAYYLTKILQGHHPIFIGVQI